MKKVLVVFIGILFIGTIVVGLSSSVALARHGGHGHGHGGHHGGHHGGYHRGFWGYGPGAIVGSSPVVVDEECRMVKRCWINPYGEKRCQLVQECY